MSKSRLRANVFKQHISLLCSLNSSVYCTPQACSCLQQRPFLLHAFHRFPVVSTSSLLHIFLVIHQYLNRPCTLTESDETYEARMLCWNTHWVSSFIQAWHIFHSYHAITLCPCTGMLMVFTVSSFLFFSVLLFLWLAETGKYENIVNPPPLNDQRPPHGDC